MPHYSDDANAICVKAYIKLRSVRKTALLTGVSKSSVSRWVHKNPLVRRIRGAVDQFGSNGCRARIMACFQKVPHAVCGACWDCMPSVNGEGQKRCPLCRVVCSASD